MARRGRGRARDGRLRIAVRIGGGLALLARRWAASWRAALARAAAADAAAVRALLARGRRDRRGALVAARHGRLAAGASARARRLASAQAMLWPISFSIAATDLPSTGLTMVMAVPVLPARPVRPMRWT